jgi:hypothetical protein
MKANLDFESSIAVLLEQFDIALKKERKLLIGKLRIQNVACNNVSKESPVITISSTRTQANIFESLLLPDVIIVRTASIVRDNNALNMVAYRRPTY